MARKDKPARVAQLERALTPTRMLFGVFTQSQIQRLQDHGYTVAGALVCPERVDLQTWSRQVQLNHRRSLETIEKFMAAHRPPPPSNPSREE